MEIKEKKRTTTLNKRELIILKYIAKGYSNAEISEFMELAYSTFCAALNSLYLKTDTINRATLVAWGFRNNYLKQG